MQIYSSILFGLKYPHLISHNITYFRFLLSLRGGKLIQKCLICSYS